VKKKEPIPEGPVRFASGKGEGRSQFPLGVWEKRGKGISFWLRQGTVLFGPTDFRFQKKKGRVIRRGLEGETSGDHRSREDQILRERSSVP